MSMCLSQSPEPSTCLLATHVGVGAVSSAVAVRREPAAAQLRWNGIPPHTNMKIQTITSKRERLAKWQAIHKQLLGTDAQYRKRHTSFLITIVCLSCVIVPFYLPFFGIRLFGFAVDVSIISCVAATIVFLALRQFQFQNQRIQSCLQSGFGTQT